MSFISVDYHGSWDGFNTNILPKRCIEPREVTMIRSVAGVTDKVTSKVDFCSFYCNVGLCVGMVCVSSGIASISEDRII